MTKQPIVFDIETDGFNPSVVHCLVIHKDGKSIPFVGNEIPKGINQLADNIIVGHNVIKFDLPVLNKLYGYKHNPELVHDTLCLSRLIYPDITNSVDVKLSARGLLDKSFWGKHSLKAWGVRLQMLKGDYAETHDFKNFSQEMLDYCIQDVKITKALYDKLIAKGFSKESITLEHEVSHITQAQEIKGFGFDEIKAQDFHAKLLARSNELTIQLEKAFGEWEVDLGEFVPKVNNKSRGYVKGVPVKKSKIVKFNPSSRQHIANRLMKLYNWKPKEFTETKLPIVDEDVLSSLDYPETKLLSEYLVIEKRLGLLADGKNAWLKVVKNGRVHTNYTTNIISGRMSSSRPNLQQVPNLSSPYGKECRELFIPTKGYKLVGCDASGLEAYCLAHYIINYEGGKEYVDMLLNGDVHTYNQKKIGLPTRDMAKTVLYASLYGASFKRISEICNVSITEGKRILDSFYKNLPFLKLLKEDLIGILETRGFIRGIDKRILTTRSNHSLINFLCQSCGGIVMKQALVFLWEEIKDMDAFVVANIHDEYQIEARPEIADEVGKIAVDSIRRAGEFFKLRVPLKAEYRVGNNWAETH